MPESEEEFLTEFQKRIKEIIWAGQFRMEYKGSERLAFHHYLIYREKRKRDGVTFKVLLEGQEGG